MDLNQIFSTESVPEIASGKSLKEKDLLSRPVSLRADQSFPIKTSEVTFSIGTSASLQVALFNDVDDRDEATIVNSEKPFLDPDYSTTAALKYSLGVNAKANGSASLNDIGFDLGAEGLIETGYYSLHASDEKIRGAVLEDLTSFPAIFRFEDVRNLEEGHVLYLRSAGQLNAKVAVSWADILSKSIGKLAELVSEDLSLDISIGASAAADFEVSVKDDFLYAIKKLPDDKLLVRISKSDERTTGGRVSASVGASFANPDQIEGQLNRLADQAIESITAASKEQLSKLLDHSTSGQLTAEEIADAGMIASRLGLGSDQLGEPLKERIESLRKRIKSVLSDVAKANVKLSFTYEYKRVRSSKELLMAVFDREVLSAYHSEFLKFRLKNFLGKVFEGGGNMAGVDVQKYLNEKQVSTSKSWGFGFSVAGKGFSGRDFEEVDRIIRKNLEGRRQVVIDITRGYKSKWFGTDVSWLGNFNAEMDGFSVLEHPTMQEFDYSMYLNMNFDLKADEEKLREFLDLGVLWGATDQKETDRLTEKYLSSLKDQQATFEARLLIPDAVMRPLAHQLTRNGFNATIIQLLGQSLAGAMSYMKTFTERQTVRGREALYAGLWEYYLQNPRRSTAHYADVAGDTLREKVGNNNLSRGEEQLYNQPGSEYFSSMIFTNRNLYKDITSFLKGMHTLSNGMTKNSLYDDEFEGAYRRIIRFFDQSFYVRTLGAFLVKLINQNPIWRDQYERVLTITYGEGDQEQVINIGGNT